MGVKVVAFRSADKFSMNSSPKPINNRVNIKPFGVKKITIESMRQK